MKYPLSYLMDITIEAESKEAAQRKLIDHLNQSPGHYAFGRFMSQKDAHIIYHMIDGASEEEARRLVEKIDWQEESNGLD